MALTITWTPKAIHSYGEILTYIEFKFGLNAAKKYSNQIENTVKALTTFPGLGTIQNQPRNIRGLVVKKHTTLFYTTSEKQLVILNVFDNRFDPAKRI